MNGFACAILVTGIAAAATGERVINFDRDRAGSLPADWEAAMTRSGAPPQWQVVPDDTAPSQPNVLAQLSTDRTAGRFPLAIYQGAMLRDGEISVRFKPMSGAVDEAAGLVWRYLDRNNYYIVRANALEKNVVLYKVQSGERTSLPPRGLPSRSYGVKHDVPKLTWSALKVVFGNSLATVYFDGEKLFEVEDGTFAGPGKVGLWTKADSVTYFDDFRFSGH